MKGVRGQEHILNEIRAGRGFFDLWIHVLVLRSGQEHVSIAANHVCEDLSTVWRNWSSGKFITKKIIQLFTTAAQISRVAAFLYKLY
ncbi:hypothetical protein PUR_26890 [Paenibacillus sp. URB8-2]|nr:hypothetical protein PUR_26890 [Paenibacillus sp. URB8-2]